MPGNPANVSRAKIGVLLVVVENVLVRNRRINHVAGGRVKPPSASRWNRRYKARKAGLRHPSPRKGNQRKLRPPPRPTTNRALLASRKQSRILRIRAARRCRFPPLPPFEPTQLDIALSAFGFIGIALDPRKVPFAVIKVLQFESTIRSAKASAEKPPNTTECTAPIRAHANIAMVASGTMGM